MTEDKAMACGHTIDDYDILWGGGGGGPQAIGCMRCDWVIWEGPGAYSGPRDKDPWRRLPPETEGPGN